jgi:hypothetical protein
MKLRIAIWAGTGALVVVLWSLYIFLAKSTPLGAMWTLVDLTCPIALARRYPLSIYPVLLANAATYALIGTVVETMRRHFKHARLVSN